MNDKSKLPAAPPSGETTEVYEVYGKTARGRGWDFMVCTSLKDALGIIESDLDELDANPDEDDQVRISFRRYTKEQMDEVIYE